MTRVAVAAWLFLCVLGVVAPDSEYGRAIGAEVALAVTHSLIVGIGVLVPILLVASWIGIAALHRERPPATFVANTLANIVDSVPSVLWVLATVVLVDEPRRLAAIVAFAALSFPGSVRIVLGECSRQRLAPYLLAARALGASATRLFWRHVLPNASGTWAPYAIQLFGSAIAVEGAIGLLGAGNRTDLNLGTLLLRGKEQLMLSPWLLGLALLAYLALFATLYVMFDKVRAAHRQAAWVDFSRTP
jgi:ABC-type dipeptide/oligopeptide/nickel transport system permease subunit